jgi:hypothetical protein
LVEERLDRASLARVNVLHRHLSQVVAVGGLFKTILSTSVKIDYTGVSVTPVFL